MCRRISSTARLALALGTTLVAGSSAAESSGPAASSDTGLAIRAPAAPPSPAFHPGDNREFVLSAAPREEDAESIRIYGPVAEYLSKVIGRPIVYKHPGTWGVYQGMMQKGARA
jgi:ABC-type phosphate/phosphonate transport system substrate-binding protein